MTCIYAVFEEYGLQRGVIFPTYGLAEHCVYVCSNGLGKITVNKEVFERDHRIERSADMEGTIDFVACGFQTTSFKRGAMWVHT